MQQLQNKVFNQLYIVNIAILLEEEVLVRRH